MWLTFHSDFSIAASGFEATWSTLELTGCPRLDIYEPQGEVFSPNFPHYYLPQLNCSYNIIAPGKFISVSIQCLFSVGIALEYNKGY